MPPILELMPNIMDNGQLISDALSLIISDHFYAGHKVWDTSVSNR